MSENSPNTKIARKILEAYFIATMKLGNYCSWRGVIGVTLPVSSFNIYIFNF